MDEPPHRNNQPEEKQVYSSISGSEVFDHNLCPVNCGVRFSAQSILRIFLHLPFVNEGHTYAQQGLLHDYKALPH